MTHVVYIERKLQPRIGPKSPAGALWVSPRMDLTEAEALHGKLAVLGKGNREDLVAGRLVLYRRADQEWGFALPEVLEILGGWPPRRMGNCAHVHPNGALCEGWRRRNSRFCYAHRKDDDS